MLIWESRPLLELQFLNANILKGSRNGKSSAVDTLVRKHGVEYTTIYITIKINKRSSAVRVDTPLTLSPKGYKFALQPQVANRGTVVVGT